MKRSSFTRTAIIFIALGGLVACETPTDPEPVEFRDDDVLGATDLTMRPRVMAPEDVLGSTDMTARPRVLAPEDVLGSTDMAARSRKMPGAVAPIDGFANPTGTPPDFALCAEIEDEAFALVAKFARCEEDRQCHAFTSTDLGLEGTCLPMFECYVALVDRPDLRRFAARANRLDQEYQAANCPCPMATCADPDYTFSTCPADACTVDIAEPTADPRAM